MAKRVVLISLALMLFLNWHWFEPAARKNQQGITAYRNGKYEKALEEFLSAKGLAPDTAALKNNTAAALYQMKKYKEALEEFSKIDPEKADIPAADFHYNIGNSFFRLNQFDKALESYKKSLLANPRDMDTKKNYELTLQKLKDQQQQKKEDQQQKQDQQEQDKDKEKQQPQQQPQQQKPEQKHQNLMQYLNQEEKKELEKKKKAAGIARKEKDW